MRTHESIFKSIIMEVWAAPGTRVMCPMWPGLLCDSMPGLSDPRPPHNSHNISPLLKAQPSPANERQDPTLCGQSEAFNPVWSLLRRVQRYVDLITTARL